MSGNRAALPDQPLKVCASCLAPRGNKRAGWTPITRAGEVVGYTCARCPRHDEPIRREVAAVRREVAAVPASRPTPETPGIRSRIFCLREPGTGVFPQVRGGTGSRK